MANFLECALELAGKGFPVFPLKKGTNTPNLKKWPTAATTDVEQIRQWWSGRNKNRNVGVACQDKVVILDVDIKAGRDGRPELKRLIAAGLPKTYTVQTPSGGYHLYFKHPGGWVKSVANFWSGIDIRGNGGQGAGAGSVTPDGEYKVLHDIEVAELPEKFRLPLKGAESAEESVTDSIILDSLNQYSELPPEIKCGERDDVLFRYACSWRERGYAKAHAQVLMKELHSRLEQPPEDEYSLEDALKKLEQAWTNYTASEGEWTQVITPQGPVVAPTAAIKSVKEALERFVFIIDGNRVADLNRVPYRAVMKLEEFNNAFGNVWIGTTKLPTKWIGNRSRQTVRGTIYYPTREQIIHRDSEQFFNEYTGSLQDLPAKLDQSKVTPFLDHVRYILGDKEAATRFVYWCAVSIQKPESRIPWIPLIITTPRCGKGLIFKVLQKVVGKHNTSKISPTELEDFAKGFNSWLSKTLFVCIEEIKTTRRWEITERLKDITTETELLINHKHGKKQQEDIFCNIVAFSNHSDAVAIDKTDGRFWVICNRCERRPSQYYKDLIDWINSDGPAHLELFLKRLDISEFEWAEPPPMTDAKRLMIGESTSIIEQRLTDAIEDREGPFRADIIDLTLVEQFLQTEEQENFSSKDRYIVRKILNDATFALEQDRYRVSLSSTGTGKRYRCRGLRNKKHWQKATPDEVAVEYKRAWLFANGHNPQTDLKEVRDDEHN